MSKNRVSLLFFVLFLTGCQGNVAPSKSVSLEREAEPVIETERVTLEATQPMDEQDTLGVEEEAPIVKPEKQLTAAERLTLSLIEQGEAALSAERLLTPEDDNANLYFQAALGRDPGNFKATLGIATIVDVYTQWAWEAALSHDYNKSDRYLESARSVNPEDPMIVEMSSRVNDLMNKRARTPKAVYKKPERKEPKEGQYLLPESLFSLSEDEIIAEIQPIIDEVTKTEQAIEIYWPDDKEARLIYQIINSRITAFRVRAMTYHRADYMVELQQD